MKKIMAAIALCASLSACNTGAVQSAGQVAEKGSTAANDLYVGASKAGEALVEAGLWDKASYKQADNAAYAMLQQVNAGSATIQQLATLCAILAGGK